jgi:hypothetical protein
MLLRIAFAMRLWFTGLRPVSLLCFILPIGVIYSDMIEKFYTQESLAAFPEQSSQPPFVSTEHGGMQSYLVFVNRVQIQNIKNIHCRNPPLLPLPHLHRAQIMRRINLTHLPTPTNLLAEIRAQLMVLQLLGRAHNLLLMSTALVGPVDQAKHGAICILVSGLVDGSSIERWSLIFATALRVGVGKIDAIEGERLIA